MPSRTLTLDAVPDPSLEAILSALDLVDFDPRKLLSVVVGGDPINDILSAVKTLIGIPGRLIDWLSDKFTGLLNYVADQASTLYDHLSNVVNWAVGGISDGVNNIYNFVIGLPDMITNGFNWVINQLSSGLNSVSTFVSQGFNVVEDFVSSVYNSLSQLVSSSVQWVGDQVSSGLNAIGNFVSQGFNAVLGIINALPGEIENLLSSGLQWVGGQIQAGFNSAYEHVEQVGGQIGQTVISTVISGAASIGEGFMDGLNWLIDEAFDPIESFVGAWSAVPGKILGGHYATLDELLDDISGPIKPGSFGGLMFGLAAAIPMLASLLTQLGGIYAQEPVQRASQLIGAQLPSQLDVRDSFLRGQIPEAEHDDLLGRMGFSQERVKLIKDLYFDIPPPSDLIRMAVREAFSPDVIQAFGQDQDFPQDFANYSEQIGISEDWAHRYWAAHWQLPATGQAFEMFRRKVIDQDTLNLLLRAADVMPFWRDKLTQIQYAIPTRRDLPRLFAAGVYDEDQLQTAYEALGFEPTLAGSFVQLAKKSAAGKVPELPRGVITTGYREGLLDRDAAAGELRALKYVDEDIDFLLDQEDYKNARDLANLQEDVVEADFKAGLSTETSARAVLLEIGVPSARADLLLQRWRNRKAAKTATLTVSQIQRLFREGRIPAAGALGRFAALGYNQADASDLLYLAIPDKAEKEPPHTSVSQLFLAQRRGLITPAQLHAELQLRGYSVDDIALLVELAETQNVDLTPPELTLAELLKAEKKKVISPQQLQARLVARGYRPADVDVYLQTEGVVAGATVDTPAPKPRALTVAQDQKAFKDGFIDEPELRKRLAALNFNTADIDILVELARPEPPDAGNP